MIGSSRRSKPKVIREASGSDEEDFGKTKPLNEKPKTVKPKNSTKLRLSFGVEDEGSFAPKKSTLRQKSSIRDVTSNLEQQSISRPVYTKSYLSQLKTSTPSTPKEYHSSAASDESLDVEGKFGMVVGNQQSSIPDPGIVKAIKDRRARRKDGADFISLGESQSLVSSKKVESRLVREDDEYGDGIDGLEAYVDHGIILRKDGEQILERKRREEMREAVQGDSSESENSAMDEWELSQIRKGDFSVRESGSSKSRVPVPPTVTALPTLSGSLTRLRGMMNCLQEKKEMLNRQAQELSHEMSELLLREKLVQQGLEKASQDYENLQKERGLETIADQKMAVN